MNSANSDIDQPNLHLSRFASDKELISYIKSRGLWIVPFSHREKESEEIQEKLWISKQIDVLFSCYKLPDSKNNIITISVIKIENNWAEKWVFNLHYYESQATWYLDNWNSNLHIMLEVFDLLKWIPFFKRRASEFGIHKPINQHLAEIYSRLKSLIRWLN